MKNKMIVLMLVVVVCSVPVISQADRYDNRYGSGSAAFAGAATAGVVGAFVIGAMIVGKDWHGDSKLWNIKAQKEEIKLAEEQYKSMLRMEKMRQKFIKAYGTAPKTPFAQEEEIPQTGAGGAVYRSNPVFGQSPIQQRINYDPYAVPLTNYTAPAVLRY